MNQVNDYYEFVLNIFAVRFKFVSGRFFAILNIIVVMSCHICQCMSCLFHIKLGTMP